MLRYKQADFECIDLREQGLSEQDLDKAVNHFIYQPEVYQQERFMRIAVIKYDDRDVLLLSSHHALLDGISIVLIAQATAQFYALLVKGEKVDDLPALPDTFKSYLLDELQRTDTRRIKDFWQSELQACEPLNNAPMGLDIARTANRLEHDSDSVYDVQAQAQSTEVLSSFAQPAKTTEQGLQLSAYTQQKIQRLNFSAQHWSLIKSYCRSHKMTPPQYFKLLYALLITQYCGAAASFSLTEFSAGRDRKNAFSLGCFFKQSPYVFNAEELGHDVEMSNLFQRQRDFRRHAKDFLNISASLSASLQHNAAVQFMFNYYHFFPSDQTLEGKPITCIEMPPFIENAVQFVVKEQGDIVSLDLYFQDNVFNELNFLQRIEVLSAQLVQQADTLSQLSYLLPLEFVQQVYQWNKPQVLQLSVPLIQKFEQQVKHHPQQLALIDADEELSYQALNQRANKIAHQLQELGVGANVRVAFCLPRGADAITVILAVMKLGATYVPIDESYPQERIALIIKMSQARVLFVASALSLNIDVQVLTINKGQVDDLPAPNSASNLSIEAHAEDTLYIIFTSGSTGTPKGAAVSYANERNLLQWYGDFEFKHSKTLVFSPLGFDLTQKNLLAPLVFGGQLILLAGNYDSEKILKAIERHGITHINCAPSLFYPLMEDYPQQRVEKAMKQLRVLSLGGEAIQLSRFSAWFSSDDCHCKVYNHYGPTECTDIALYHQINFDDAQRRGVIPLGRPNAGVQVYIMNERLQLLPAGVTGQICIAGNGVGLGYINDEKLSQEKFVANPLGAGKLYLSGDLGRYGANANIEFIGRKDDQLKINGLRIEPGEVAARLEALDDVQGALVQLNDAQLVAYVLTPQTLDLHRINQQLAAVLPEYMLPKHLLCLKAWPLTPNGKIDRSQLPLPGPSLTTEYVAPKTDVERELCAILEHVLAMPKVGIYDNFFELGGHSLAASRAIVQVRQKYQVDIPLNVLFELSTVEKLAAWISASQWAQHSAESKGDEEGRDSGFI